MIKKIFYKYILHRIYYKSGQCNRCGDCCTKIYVNHKNGIIKTKEQFEKLKKLHPFYSYLSVVEENEKGVVFECSNFDKINHICKIHKKRPLICRKYPDEIIFKLGAELGEKCGYKFTPIIPFKDILNKAAKCTNKKKFMIR